jgi:OOP family OmpA-OmpF porin
MKKPFIQLLLAVSLVFTWMVAQTTAFEIVTQEMMEKQIVTETDLIRTADNFIIVFDASNSANEMVPGMSISRIQAAKEMLQERNQWLPDLGYTAGLFKATSSGHEVLYPLLPYNRDSFGAAIDKLPDEGSGPTMAQQVLSSLRDPIGGLSGKTAVIMFTDGTYNRVRGPKSALQIAQGIAKDNDVCFYLISSATDAENEQLLASVAKLNACSRVLPIDDFLNNPHYLSGALFTVKTTSYEKLVPVTKKIAVASENVLFDFDGDEIRSEYVDRLNELGDFLKQNPNTSVVLAGYADSSGDEEYNMGLSEFRARSVKNYLANQSRIDPDRIITLWFGELNPVGDNATSEGRQLNRRVELAVGGLD